MAEGIGRSVAEVTRRGAIAAGIGVGIAPVAALSAGETAPGSVSRPTDIIDAQVHIGRDGIAPTLAGMDALGIGAALLYEHWGTSITGDPRHYLPGYLLPNGAWRAASAVATEACILHPDRFGSVVKVDRRDPQVRAVLETLRSTPYVRAVRVLPVWTTDEAAAFRAGAYDALFGILAELRLPAFLFIPGFVAALRPYLRAHPKLTVIVDHLGMPFPGIPQGGTTDAAGRGADYFGEVLKLAEYPNVALKWSHANQILGFAGVPEAAVSSYLRRAITAFGSRRIIWAADHTMIHDHTWSELLEAITADDTLLSSERIGLLGGSTRHFLDWQNN